MAFDVSGLSAIQHDEKGAWHSTLPGTSQERECHSSHMLTTVDQQLSKEVPTHLFKFEDKIFGLTIPQLLMDTFGGVGAWYVSKLPLPIALRIACCVCVVILVLAVVHVRFKKRPLVEWGTISLLFWLTPPKTLWYSEATSKVQEARGQKPKYPSVQSTWLRLASIEGGYMGFVDGSTQKDKKQKGKSQAAPTRYYAVVEVIGVNLQLLASKEQARIFTAYERFLAGLEFPLQIISYNNTIDTRTYEPLLANEQQIALLKGKPRLAAMAENNVRFLRQRLGTCIVTRHFVVVGATTLEEALQDPEGKMKSGFPLLFAFRDRKKKQITVAKERVIQQLRLRLRVVEEGFKDMGLQTYRLDDAALAKFYASCLVPGVTQKRGEDAADELAPITMLAKKQHEIDDEEENEAVS